MLDSVDRCWSRSTCSMGERGSSLATKDSSSRFLLAMASISSMAAWQPNHRRRMVPNEPRRPTELVLLCRFLKCQPVSPTRAACSQTSPALQWRLSTGRSALAGVAVRVIGLTFLDWSYHLTVFRKGALSVICLPRQELRVGILRTE